MAYALTHKLIDEAGRFDRRSIMREAHIWYARVRTWHPTADFASQLRAVWRCARSCQFEHATRDMHPATALFLNVGRHSPHGVHLIGG